MQCFDNEQRDEESCFARAFPKCVKIGIGRSNVGEFPTKGSEARKVVETFHVVAEDVASSTPGWNVDPTFEVGGPPRSLFPRGVDPISHGHRQPMEGSGNVVEEVAMTWSPCHEGGEIRTLWRALFRLAGFGRQQVGARDQIHVGRIARQTAPTSNPRDPLPREIMEHQPLSHFDLDEKMFGRNLRSSRRRVAEDHRA